MKNLITLIFTFIAITAVGQHWKKLRGYYQVTNNFIVNDTVTIGSDTDSSGYFRVYGQTYLSDTLAIGLAPGEHPVNIFEVDSVIKVDPIKQTILIGNAAGSQNPSGYSNIKIGDNGFNYVVTGNYNIGFGHSAANNITSGSHNMAIGTQTLGNIATGSYNVAIGSSSLVLNISGLGNVAIGYNAGRTNVGNYNVFIGYYCGYNETGSNKLYIENSSSAIPLIYGEFDNDILKFNGKTGTPNNALTLDTLATTFAVTSNVMTVTGDTGGNTIATITGGVDGQLLTLIFVDGLINITDDNDHTANSIDLSAAFTSADDTTLQLVFDGSSWYEISRSTN